MALAEPTALPMPEPRLAAPRIRRCTFRRMTAVDGRYDRSYDVDCLFPDRALARPVGDMQGAMATCNACTAAGVFRADED